MHAVAEDTAAGRIEGEVAPGWEPVAEAFLANFRERGEAAASVHLRLRGEVVVDLWGGAAADGTVCGRDEVQVLFSCTKAASAVVLHLLAERGTIDLDAPAAEWWPELAAEGKESLTPRMILDHTAGLPAFREPVPADLLVNQEEAAARLAAQAPFWEPGSRTGYHALTYGVLLGELVRRADGRSLGRVFAEEVAGPLGLDLHIGLPESEEGRVLPIAVRRPSPEDPETPFTTAATTRGTITNLFVFNSGDWATKGLNTREGRAAEIPSAGGIGNARSLAGLFDALMAGRVLKPETVAGLSRCSSATHLDATLRTATRFGPGFMLAMEDRRKGGSGEALRIPPGAFGHTGAGGSLGFADPESGLAFGYAMTRMGFGLFLNPRGEALLEAARACLARAA
jgi:CubicO group peptidase (beta-lactamase class C family)